MSALRARGIVASSFVAGSLLAAAIVAPQAWEPTAEPVPMAETPVDPLTGPEAVEAAIAITMRVVEAADPGARPPQRPPVRLASRPDMDVTIVLPADEAEVNTVRELAVRSKAAEVRDPQTHGLPPLVAVEQAAPAPRTPPTTSIVREHAPAAATPAPAAVAEPPRSLGAPPLPGEAWNDPDSVNWSQVPTADRAAEARPHASRGESRPLARLREWRTARLAERAEAKLARRDGGPAERVHLEHAGPAGTGWPVPTAVIEQIEQMELLAAATVEHEGPLHARRSAWLHEATGLLENVLSTDGPRDERAAAALVSLGENVRTGLGLADEDRDAGRAATTRRLALALARRVAIWRAASGLCLAPPSPGESPQHRITAEYAMVALIDAIERFEQESDGSDAATIASSCSHLASIPLPTAQALAREVGEHYRAANVRIAVHQDFLDRLLPEPVEDQGPVDEVILGRRVRGTRSVVRSTTVRMHPDPSSVSLDIEVKGDVDSRTVTESGPVSVKSRSLASFTVHKPLRLTANGLEVGKARSAAAAKGRNDALETTFDSVPIMRSLVRNIAKNQHAEAMPDATREMLDRIVARSRQEVDDETNPKFAEVESQVRAKLWEPFSRLGLAPTALGLESSQSAASLRVRLAADEQLSGHTPRPRTPAAAVLSMQLHQSSFNNVVGRLGVTGRTMTLEELVASIHRKLGLEPRLDDDLPEGVKVTFGSEEPVRVTAVDGKLKIRVAIERLESPRRTWEGVVANVAYRPTVSGLQVLLERDGVVQLSGENQRGRLEVALRTIFGKIFSRERPIPVLPERVVENPRMHGLSVLEAAVTDGWLAISLGPPVPPKPPLPATASGPRLRRF